MLVDDNTWCWGPAPEHSFNFVSNTYPSTNTLYQLCVDEVTAASNVKAARNGDAYCQGNTNYHGACFNPTPYSRGVVEWGAVGATAARHTLNGWATTTGPGCPL